MSYSTRAAIMLIFSVGLVISYPAFTYPPMKKAARRILWILAWPLRAAWRIIQWLAAVPAEWIQIQKEIPELLEAAQRKEDLLNEAAGRMWLATQLYTNKPRILIGDADRDHGAVIARHAELKADTFGRPVWEEDWYQIHEKAFSRPDEELRWQIDLWLAWAIWRILALIFSVSYALPRMIPRYRRLGPRSLRNLKNDWLSLHEQQMALRGLMETIPDRTKIYDRLEKAKVQKLREQEQQDELLRPLKSTELNFEAAKGYIKRLEIRRRYAPTKGSAVLSLEDLLRKWRVRVGRIERARSEERNPEEIIAAIKSFVEDMSLAGKYGAKVVRTERKVQQIRSLHKRLKRRFRGLTMPDEEVKAITIIMRQVVSPLWAEARWDELKEALDTVLEHIQYYESDVLRRAWLLQAGSFEELVAKVFRMKAKVRAEQIRFHPDAGQETKQAVEGSTRLSPFAGRVQEHDSERSSRFAKRGR